jgi:hypothetical protein
MARQQRSTTLSQESTRSITRVALYARVSTLNNQDPEMQLAELREYAGRRGFDPSTAPRKSLQPPPKCAWFRSRRRLYPCSSQIPTPR